jgi:hypothetical protein
MQLALGMSFLELLFFHIFDLQLPSPEALETAQELQKYTSEARDFLFHSADGVTDSAGAQVHLLARPRALPEGGEGVRFAYQTHYARCLSGGCGKELLSFLRFAMILMEILIL